MPLGMEVGFSPGDFVLDGDPAPFPKRGRSPQFSAHVYCGQTAGWMKMALWHGGRPWSRPHCARWDTAPLPKKGAAPPIFGPSLLWPNGWMHQDAIWYGGRPRPTRHCVRCGPRYPQTKGHTHSTPFLAHVYCGQMAGWMKTPLGTEVDLGPGHIVVDVVPAPAKGAQQPPSFRAISIVSTVAHLSYC